MDAIGAKKIKMKKSKRGFEWGKLQFKYRSIRARLLIIFSVFIFFLIGIGASTLLMFRSVNANVEKIIDEDMVLVQSYEKMSYLMSQRVANLHGYLLTSEGRYLLNFNENVKESETYQQEITALDADSTTDNLFESLSEWEVYVQENIITVLKDKQRAQAVQNMNTYANPKAEEILAAITERSDSHSAAIQLNGEVLVANTNRGALILAMGVAVISLLAVVVALLFSRDFAKSIQIVMHRLNTIKSGLLNQEPLPVDGGGEVVALTQATNDMQTHLLSIINQMKTSAEALMTQSETLSFSASEVQSGSEQVAVTMQELATGTENQAQSTSLLATNMTAFKAEVETVTRAGKTANKSSQTIVSLSGKGKKNMTTSKEQMENINQIVEEAVLKMETLDQGTKEIGKLVAIINDVANQTNLLALNAAIEAARAGEHGRGFAVVADEVRKLSERVAESVKDITAFVTNIQSESHVVVESLQMGYKEVQAGLSGITETSQTFDTITHSLETVVANITQINKELNQLAETGNDMSHAISEIASVSEESAAGVEQTSAASQEINSTMEEVATNAQQIKQQAELLNKVVNQFQIN
ncbi:methyl-accepting chemotaxis protein [Jeotgalibaca porci]|uniref:methyl-accepting chemotaxis protein n=1 Tax=Jeotgalibaca porci TaxID=1868793 RepID=UPI00359FDA88